MESAVLELRLILTVMRVRSHRRERSEHLPCGYSLLIYPGCHLRRLSGTGLERKSPHNQSTRHCRFDIAVYIVLRDGTHNSRTRMTQRNSYTAWAGLRRLNQDTQRNCAQHWMEPLPDHWKPSGPGLVPTQPVPHSARWTYAAPTLSG